MALCAAVRDSWSGEAVIESSPVGESRSNGQVERAVQEVRGLTRTYRDDFEIGRACTWIRQVLCQRGWWNGQGRHIPCTAVVGMV